MLRRTFAVSRFSSWQVFYDKSRHSSNHGTYSTHPYWVLVPETSMNMEQKLLEKDCTILSRGQPLKSSFGHLVLEMRMPVEHSEGQRRESLGIGLALAFMVRVALCSSSQKVCSGEEDSGFGAPGMSFLHPSLLPVFFTSSYGQVDELWVLSSLSQAHPSSQFPPFLYLIFSSTVHPLIPSSYTNHLFISPAPTFPFSSFQISLSLLCPLQSTPLYI